jgi:hypothetical protein
MSKLNVLGAWNGGGNKFYAGKSAQSFMGAGLTAMAASGCGPSCGVGGGGVAPKKEEPKTGSCNGSCNGSCGAGDDGKDKEDPKPSSGCGAGDEKK